MAKDNGKGKEKRKAPPPHIPRGQVPRGQVKKGTIPRGQVPKGTVPRGQIDTSPPPPAADVVRCSECGSEMHYEPFQGWYCQTCRTRFHR